jgi:hypothetical protein
MFRYVGTSISRYDLSIGLTKKERQCALFSGWHYFKLCVSETRFRRASAGFAGVSSLNRILPKPVDKTVNHRGNRAPVRHNDVIRIAHL